MQGHGFVWPALPVASWAMPAPSLSPQTLPKALPPLPHLKNPSQFFGSGWLAPCPQRLTKEECVSQILWFSSWAWPDELNAPVPPSPRPPPIPKYKQVRTLLAGTSAGDRGMGGRSKLNL